MNAWAVVPAWSAAAPLAALRLSGDLAATPPGSAELVLPESADGPLLFRHSASGASFSQGVGAPLLEFAEGRIGGPDLAPVHLKKSSEDPEGEVYLAVYPPKTLGGCTVHLHVRWRVNSQARILHKQAHLRVEGDDPAASLALHRVVLLNEPAPPEAHMPRTGIQSYPVFGPTWFAGVEFPIAEARIADGRLIMGHAPGARLRPGDSYDSRRLVIGLAEAGRVRKTFNDYIQSHRPRPVGLHFNYNSWWTLGLPYSEADVLGAMAMFRVHLFEPYQARFDSFSIDLGWSARHGIWEINSELMPRGFATLNAEIARQKASLGLWWSPSNYYTPASFDNEWAHREGYESFIVPESWQGPIRILCPARGTRYQQAARRAMAGLVGQYRLGQIKCDGYCFECPAEDHGHLPGPLSRESTAAGLIDILEAAREANPELWIETTCFGANPSPWWLMHADSVIGSYGDDAPAGAVPAPIYRESYTTSRDFFNLQNHDAPVPPAAQEVLGIIHQCPDPLFNDAVICVLRGHQFISLYLNPGYLRPAEYAFLAELMAWGRAHEHLLADTVTLLPEGWDAQNLDPRRMPRRTYGYAHLSPSQTLICLRNPWIAMDRIRLPLDRGPLAGSVGDTPCLLEQIYPEPALLHRAVTADTPIEVLMEPYETRVLRLVPGPAASGVAPAGGAAPVDSEAVRAAVVRNSLLRIEEVQPRGPVHGDSHTIRPARTIVDWHSELRGYVPAEGWKIFYLLEGPDPIPRRAARLEINGRDPIPLLRNSQDGWSSCAPALRHHYWSWMIAPLPAGEWTCRAGITACGAECQASVWLVFGDLPDLTRAAGVDARPPARPPDGTPGPPPPFPVLPVSRLRASVPVLAPTTLDQLPAEVCIRPAGIERIPGIYLDRLTPVSAAQGWGTLQANRSVTGDELAIGQHTFSRGLGTHAPARLVYRLDGRYRRLRGYVGVQASSSGTLTFDFHVDGRHAWTSPILTRKDGPLAVDLDLHGAGELIILVGDAGDSYISDHANIADAWLELAS